MRAILRSSTLGWIMVIAASGLASAPAQDVANGQRLAAQRCVGCHAVEGTLGKASKLGRPRTLRSIADTERVDAATIAAFLQMPHARMPNLMLSRQDSEDIAAYIAGLKSSH